MKIQSKFFALAALVLATASFSGCASDPKATDASGTPDATTEKGEKKYRYEDAPADSGTDKAAKKKKDDTYTLINCTNGIENRTLSIAVDETGCKLMYEKNEKIDVAAESANGTSHCMNAREKIRKRLVAAGWKCIQ
jgi:hypothetical protein